MEQPETTQHFWVCKAHDLKRQQIKDVIIKNWKEKTNRKLNIHNNEITNQHAIKQKNNALNSIDITTLLQGIISQSLIELGKQVGLSYSESEKITISITKLAIEQAYDNIWKERCTLQIDWEKANGITTTNKRKQQTNTSQEKRRQNKNKLTNNKSETTIIVDNGHWCYCGIKTQTHYYQKCDIISKSNYFADKLTIDEYKGINKGGKVISINM